MATVPKMIVLFAGDDAAPTAEAVAAGASAVRFMEVDVRAAVPTATKHRQTDPHADLHAFGQYDGVVLVGDPSALEHVLAHAAAELGEHTVYGVHAPAPGQMDVVGRRGMVIAADDGVDSARRLGARVAKVAGWVRHGLGHEAEGHGHEHGHEHDRARGHHHA